MSNQLKSIDNTKDLLKDIEKAGKSELRVGFFGDQLLTIIAGSNEFGAKIPVSPQMRKFFAANGFPLKKETKYFIIPERSFIRSTLDNKENIKKAFEFGKESYARGNTLQQAIEAIGLKMVAFVQKTINSDISPENHPFTKIMKKGKSKTLIDTGRLNQGVTFKVV